MQKVEIQFIEIHLLPRLALILIVVHFKIQCPLCKVKFIEFGKNTHTKSPAGCYTLIQAIADCDARPNRGMT